MTGTLQQTLQSRERLLAMRVSALLAVSPEVLPLLVRFGFSPLEDPVLRATLAPTVTLEQALRLRGIECPRAEVLLGELMEVVPCP